MMNKNYLLKKYRILEKLSMNVRKDRIDELAAQCSYYTILSFIPFFIVVITLIQYTKIEPQALFDVISRVVPDTMREFVLGVVQEVYSKSLGTISISLIITIWSAGKGLFALTKGLQIVYHTNEKENVSYIYLRIKVILETILFIILIMVGLVFLVFGKVLMQFMQEHFEGFEKNNIVTSVVTEVTFILVTFFVFLLLYKLVPKHKKTFKSQILGAILGAIALNIISFVFSKYLLIFKGFSITYGSLSTVMLVMMWIYSCFYVVFMGAEINKLI